MQLTETIYTIIKISFCQVWLCPASSLTVFYVEAIVDDIQHTTVDKKFIKWAKVKSEGGPF